MSVHSISHPSLHPPTHGSPSHPNICPCRHKTNQGPIHSPATRASYFLSIHPPPTTPWAVRPTHSRTARGCASCPSHSHLAMRTAPTSRVSSLGEALDTCGASLSGTLQVELLRLSTLSLWSCPCSPLPVSSSSPVPTSSPFCLQIRQSVFPQSSAVPLLSLCPPGLPGVSSRLPPPCLGSGLAWGVGEAGGGPLPAHCGPPTLIIIPPYPVS